MEETSQQPAKTSSKEMVKVCLTELRSIQLICLLKER